MWFSELNPSPKIETSSIDPVFVPKPASPTLEIPSTKILSPILNGSSANPLVGVSKKQVIIPALGNTAWSIEFIPTPLELLIATILCWTESNPVIGEIIFTSDIVWFGSIGCRDELSTIIFLTGLNTSKFGADE